MMAGNRAFANQAANDAKQAAHMVTSLDNLANTVIQKNDTVEKLVMANKRLAKALADANTAITRLCLLNTSVTPTALASTDNCPCLAHWATVKPDWDCTGYCWTHGHKKKVGHFSATCSHQKDGHITSATRSNTKDGRIVNKD
jgi:hypothetical protein